MYRNVAYNLDPKNNWKGEVFLKTWDEEGNRITKILPHKSHLYYEDRYGISTSIFGDKVQKKEFASVSERYRWLDSHPALNVYECLPPTSEFLQRYYHNQNKDLDFSKYKLRIGYFDIEVAVEDEFPTPGAAKYPINLITIYDNFTETYYSLGLGDAKFDDPKIRYVKCKSEVELLAKFYQLYKILDLDIISGWNSYHFDIPYIVNRSEKVLGVDSSKRLSPVGKVKPNKIVLHGDPFDYWGFEIVGITHLDYMLLYKKYIVPVEGEKSSYALNNVGEDELGLGKVKYKGILKELYQNDFQLYTEYNIRDVKIIVDLDDKRKFIDLTRRLCNMCLIEYGKIFSSSQLIIGALLQITKEMDIHIPYIRDYSNIESVNFKGAFVKDPIAGAYRDGVMSVDARSLYPSIMIALNISPETYVGKLNEVDGGYNLTLSNNRSKFITQAQLNNLLHSGKYSIAGNNALFSKQKTGLFPIFLEGLFNKRLELKKEMQKISKKLSKAKSDEEKEELNLKHNSLDIAQWATKIVLNSTYGICGLKYSPFFNVNIAEAITLTGQKIITESSEWLEQTIKDDYKTSEDDDSSIVIYNDTDSSYINMKRIVENVAGGQINEDTIPRILEEGLKITTNLNLWCKEELSKNRLFAKRIDRIEFVRETFCDAAYFFRKKRYLLHILDDEGNKVDKFKYKGIAVTRSTYPKFARDTLKEVYQNSIKERWDNKDYINYISNLYNEFIQKDFEDISLHKGLNSYIEPVGFLQLPLKTSGHARAAAYHNQLIETLDIKNRYEDIKNGKFRVCYIEKNNEYDIPVIGFREDIPDKFKEKFNPDYRKMFTLLFLQPLSAFVSINHWNDYDFNEYEVDISEL